MTLIKAFTLQKDGMHHF